MNRYEMLLKNWCDSIVSHQLTDDRLPQRGGLLCDACTAIHGRADNAVFPLAYVYKMTGDKKYLDAIYLLLDFRAGVTAPDGGIYNDGNNAWKATTTFSIIGFYKTLVNLSDALPDELVKRLESALQSGAEWIYKNVVPGFFANINYYAASAASMGMCGRYFKNENYIALSKTMLSYCMEHFTENGILMGEGHPHGDTTRRGCRPVDIGYDIEESIPCLADAAEALGDTDTLKRLAELTLKFTDFILPDGGIDNTFGSRNNKWTYFGSRTSDGAVAAFVMLAKYEPTLYEAAKRTVEQYEKCTADGLLYGGPHYRLLGQKPCIHHTFCHAAGLADALCGGLKEGLPAGTLPCDTVETKVKHYPEIDTYKIKRGKWLASVTGYDFSNFRGSANHSSGGTLSMLYNRATGPVVMGSTLDYRLAEPLNMQLPMGGTRHSSLIMRLEYVEDGVRYVTCLDPDSVINVKASGDTVAADVTAHFVSLSGKSPKEQGLAAHLKYTFGDDVTINVSLERNVSGIEFILPIVTGSADVVTDADYKKEEIYYLSGGFAADEYRFECRDDISVTIKAKA